MISYLLKIKWQASEPAGDEAVMMMTMDAVKNDKSSTAAGVVDCGIPRATNFLNPTQHL